MFISVFDLFKIGIGPSSSHTVGPMVAASLFRRAVIEFLTATDTQPLVDSRIVCLLTGSLAYTGVGHGTDKAIILGVHGFLPDKLSGEIGPLLARLKAQSTLDIPGVAHQVGFEHQRDIHFDRETSFTEHPNGMVFRFESQGQTLLEQIYFSIGGGFVVGMDEFHGKVDAPVSVPRPYPFSSANQMLVMAKNSGLSIASMKRQNELMCRDEADLEQGLDSIWLAMRHCVESGLQATGELPGGLKVLRRARHLHEKIQQPSCESTLNDWLCAYAMAVNEENAAGHRVVTAPTNGAAGVIPAVLYYRDRHKGLSRAQIHDFLLTAAGVGGIIKHRSSISGAEVGCQGEVGSAASMAAAGLCAILGGTPEQVENAAEIALEHHLGMTCDPVGGLVQIPCIERCGFGAIKAYTAATLALNGSGQHLMPLDNCISAMKETGKEMLDKYKETSQGGLAVNFTDC